MGRFAIILDSGSSRENLESVAGARHERRDDQAKAGASPSRMRTALRFQPYCGMRRRRLRETWRLATVSPNTIAMRGCGDGRTYQE